MDSRSFLVWVWIVSSTVWISEITSLPCQETEQAALVEFYEQSGFAGPFMNQWASVAHNPSICACRWFGVKCNDQGFIVSLQLNSPVAGDEPDLKFPMDAQSARGCTRIETCKREFGDELPNAQLDISRASVQWPLSLAKLHSLQELNMYGFNHNSAQLPPEVGLLSQSLTTLILSRCGLSPSLPVEALANLSKLTLLDLSNQNGWEDGPPASSQLSNSQYFCNLTALQYLDLSQNGIIGIVPSCLSLLPHLTHLDLSQNSLEGPIPEHWATTSNLTYLDLSHNLLNTQIYPGIFGEKMVFLNLRYNNLTGNMPPNIGRLSNLKQLGLGSNSLSGSIPASLQNLTSLTALDLSKNMLSGTIPPQLGSNLVHFDGFFDLSNNQLSGSIPLSLGQLSGNTSGQVIVDLSSNNLTGDLPWLLLIGGHVSELYLASNHLSGRVTYGNSGSLVNSSTNKVSQLDLSLNDVTGPIPSWISLLHGLSILNLAHNSAEASTTLDSEAAFSNLRSLSHLDLSWNSMQGPIPSWISNQTGLHYLDLSFNQLEGTIPAWFWSNLQGIAQINLSMNKLRGDINLNGVCELYGLGSLNFSHNRFERLQGICPSGNPSNVALDLSYNNLSGVLPSSMSNLSFSSIYLRFNKLSGEIPTSLCTEGSDQLKALKLEGNLLSGPIPDNIGQHCRKLQSLVLRDNFLTGPIPSSLGNLSTSLLVLDLSHNGLEGGIPSWIQHMQSLRVLILSHNNFSGSLPPTKWNTTQLQVLDLSFNKLSGGIPGESLDARLLQGFLYNPLADSDPGSTLYDESIILQAKGSELPFIYILRATVAVDLSNNALVGSIPSQLGSLNGLIFLNLSNNHLTAKIPESLGKLQQLASLDLSKNRLVGEIPIEALCKLTFLSVVDVSNNNLEGPIPSCNQWSTFNTPKSFLGNKGLCGPPLQQQCISGNGTSNTTGNHDLLGEQHDNESFQLEAIFVGFCVAFPIVFAMSMLWQPVSYRIILVSRWFVSKVV